jgi:hypothetical protein
MERAALGGRTGQGGGEDVAMVAQVSGDRDLDQGGGRGVVRGSGIMNVFEGRGNRTAQSWIEKVNQESTKGCFKTFSLNDWEKRGGPWEERI